MKRILENTWPARRAKTQRLGQLLAEHHHGLGAHRAVLGRAEREHVDAAPPGEVGRAAAERGDGIGETRAVHVHAQAVLAGDADQLVQLIRPVDGAPFGRLGEVERRRLDSPGMTYSGLLQRRAQGLRAQPAMGLGERHDLGPAGIELPCPALAVVHVADVGAKNRTVRRRDQRQRQRVGRGPGRHRLHEAAGLEQRGEGVLQARRDRIGAVRWRRAGIRRLDRGEDLGGDAGDVVAAQIDRRVDRQRLHVALRGPYRPPKTESARPQVSSTRSARARPCATDRGDGSAVRFGDAAVFG